MTATTVAKLMTAEEFLALPDDGVERWLIRGELREKRDTDMTRRNKLHSISEAKLARILGNWLYGQPLQHGEVVSGEQEIILRRSPTSISAGVDVAIISHAQADASSRDTTMIEGPPLMIAEVLSPKDALGEIDERAVEYLDCGVKVVWVVNPVFRTVTIHRPGIHPEAVDARGTIVGEPELPGFTCPAADFFC